MEYIREVGDVLGMEVCIVYGRDGYGAIGRGGAVPVLARWRSARLLRLAISSYTLASSNDRSTAPDQESIRFAGKGSRSKNGSP